MTADQSSTKRSCLGNCRFIMTNTGEEIVAAYLEYIEQCAFIQKNLYTPDVQGEIDVVGINLSEKRIYACEVAIHLITGLQYTKNNQPNNVDKLVEKFSKDIDYIKKYFPECEYEQHFMLWSPIVKDQKPEAKHNQMRDISEIVETIKIKYNVELEVVINNDFNTCLNKLREYAKGETKNLQSPIMRYLQIEEYLKKHIE